MSAGLSAGSKAAMNRGGAGFARSRLRGHAEINCGPGNRGGKGNARRQYPRSPSVLTAEVDGEVVMMSIEQGQYFGLDDIDIDIWKRLDPPCAFADLIDRVAADYDA